MPHYHIDTDMGVDDGLALYTAHRVLGRRLRTVSTVWGNVAVATATRNALLYRALLPDADFAVVEGAAAGQSGRSRNAVHVHGRDGLGGAAGLLDRRLLARVGRMRVDGLETLPPPRGRTIIIGIGPATNIPTLVRRYGRARIERIVLMSGAFFDVGNVTPEAEFNAWSDPRALRDVLGLGVPVTFVPLDLCRKVVLTRAAVTSYLAKSRAPITRLLVAAHMHYMDHYRAWEGIDGCFPHDALAVLVASAPRRFVRVAGRVEVTLAGRGRGRTRLSPDPASKVEVALGGDLKWVRQFLASP